MNEFMSEELLPEEGGDQERSKLNQGKHRLPIMLAVVWVAFFVWMVVYLGLYMVPTLP